MRYMKFIIFCVVITLVSGCIGFVYQKKITDKYFLIAVDSPDQMALCIENKYTDSYVVRISQTVKKAGYYKTFIYAQKKDGSFWVVDSTKDSVYAELLDVVQGPLTILELKSILSTIGHKGEVVFTVTPYH